MAQPITVKPVLAKVGNVVTLPTVTFATGRYLGASDVGDTTPQSINLTLQACTEAIGWGRTTAPRCLQPGDVGRRAAEPGPRISPARRGLGLRVALALVDLSQARQRPAIAAHAAE